MKLIISPSAERGYSQLAWLDSYHTFSFDQYHDPKYMSFRSLRDSNLTYMRSRKNPTYKRSYRHSTNGSHR